LPTVVEFFVKLECQRSARVLYVGIKYSINGVIRDVTNYCVSSCTMAKIKDGLGVDFITF